MGTKVNIVCQLLSLFQKINIRYLQGCKLLKTKNLMKNKEKSKLAITAQQTPKQLVQTTTCS